MEPSIEETVELMKLAHRGQIDKGGAPYWEHPVRVAARLWQKTPGISGEATRAAILHDVIEDTTFDAVTLLAHGFSQRTIDLVSALSRDKSDGLTYRKWIETIARSGDRELILIKLADAEDNGDPDRLAKIPDTDHRLETKYDTARRILKWGLTLPAADPGLNPDGSVKEG